MNITWVASKKGHTQEPHATAKKGHTKEKNLMTLPPELLPHVLSFLSMEEIVKFAFVSQRAFEVAKAFTWERLHFSDGHYWLKDVENLCDRGQVTCRSLILPSSSRYVR
jgi:hypothetical protein